LKLAHQSERSGSPQEERQMAKLKHDRHSVCVAPWD